MKIVIDRSKFGDVLMDHFLGFWEGNPVLSFNFLSYFVIDEEGKPVKKSAAEKWLRRTYTINEIINISAKFRTEIEEQAIPKENGADSDKPLSQE